MSRRAAKQWDNDAIMARLEHMTGKAGEELYGVILAWKDSHERVAKVEARTATHDFEQLITKARLARKLTPAEEKTLREQFASGDFTLKGAAAWLASKAAIPALRNAGLTSRAALGAAGDALRITYDGKTWDELKPRERAQLKSQEPALYDQMRTEFMRLNPEQNPGARS